MDWGAGRRYSMSLPVSRFKNLQELFGEWNNAKINHAAGCGLFGAEITKQKRSLKQTPIFRLKIFSLFCFIYWLQGLVIPKWVPRVFLVQKHSMKWEFCSIWILPRERNENENGTRVHSREWWEQWCRHSRHSKHGHLGVWATKRLCNVLCYVNNFYLLRMIPNLMWVFGFSCLRHWSTDKPKSCNASAKKKTTD